MIKTPMPPEQSGPDIRQRIADALPRLTASQIRMADFVQASPFVSATMGIEDFARANQVSNATANRFVRALGFDGYPTFRASLARDCLTTLPPPERLRQAQANTRLDDHALITKALEADIENLQATRDLLDSQTCRQAVQALLDARRIFIAGMGTSALLAGQLEYGLSPYCQHAVSLAQPSGPADAARRLHDVNHQDLVVAIMFPRYVRDTAELAYMAHNRGAKVLALTDKPTSPLAHFSDIALYLQTRRDFAANSDAIVLSVIQALCGAVAYHRPHAADNATSMTHATSPWLLNPDAGQSFPRRSN